MVFKPSSIVVIGTIFIHNTYAMYDIIAQINGAKTKEYKCGWFFLNSSKWNAMCIINKKAHKINCVLLA